MNYELAKELKEAGFPSVLIDTSTKEVGLVPTLSELIEACGEDLDSLSQQDNDQDRWLAIAEIKRGRFEGGATPEEAVARLWLAINRSTQ